MEHRKLSCWIFLLMFFSVTILCSYGCVIRSASPKENHTSSIPDDTTVTKPVQTEIISPARSMTVKADESETYEMPADHARYFSEMCIMCHHQTSLSDSHQGVQDDECLDCHMLPD